MFNHVLYVCQTEKCPFLFKEPWFFKKNRGSFFTLLVIMLGLFGFLNDPLFKTITDCIGLALFIWSIFYPKREILFIIACFLFGSVNVFLGGHLLGFIYYVVAILIALKTGCFRSYPRLKITSISIVFLVLIVTQLRFSLRRFVVSLVNIGIGTILFIALALLFHDFLQIYYKQKPKLYVSRFNLDERKIVCVQGVLQGFTIEEIAEKAIASPSVIKKELVDLYELFHVHNFSHLRFFLESHEVIFQEENS